MKQTVGALVLLTGLSGCMSFLDPNDPAEKQTSRGKVSPGGATTAVFLPASPSAGIGSTQTPVDPEEPGRATRSELRSRERQDLPGFTRMAGISPSAAESSPARVDSSVVPASLSVPSPPPSASPISTPVRSVSFMPPPTPTMQNAAGETPTPRTGPPMMQMVNSKRITLNFEVKGVGPSGLAGVELWHTRDGKTWNKHAAPPRSPYLVEVAEEGMYGFTLLARSGSGSSRNPPAPGDQPQVWVIVDLTPPAVQMREVAPAPGTWPASVAIRWKASDKNLASNPITLSYAEKESGPWQVIASNVENSGNYLWQVPPGTPPRFLVRVEAVDLAGNIGQAQLSRPILLDTSMPTISILDVRSGGR